MNGITEIAVDVRDAVKRYGDFTALQQISLAIHDNEFFTLLGPSGCGKTTLLRMIAGFEDLTEGGIYLFDDEIKTLPPHKRPVNTVFQNYALFPHMTVLENVGFGLEMKGPDTPVIEDDSWVVVGADDSVPEPQKVAKKKEVVAPSSNEADLATIVDDWDD